MGKFLKKRSGAITFLIVIIIVTTILNCHRKLTEKRVEVEAMFYTGVEDEGFSINSDLEKRVEYCRNLVKIAGKYQGFDTQAETLEAACDALASRKGKAAEAFDLNRELTDAASDLYQVMEGLEAEDEKYRQELYTNILSRNDTITNEAAKYNKEALDYNSRLQTFPANILKYPAFVWECELFA